jgi:DNA recombination protein RmuC
MPASLATILALLIGAAAGAVVVWLLGRAERRVAGLRDGEQRIRDAFEALSAEALRRNGEAFLQLARTELERAQTGARVDLTEKEKAIADLLAPIKDGLAKYDAKIGEIEKSRAESFGALAERLESVARSSESLRAETQKLAQALRAPAVRGRWGEIQLKRVVELAGMLEHCDFTTQESVASTNGDGRLLRPDMTVRLPNGRTIVVDSKVPLEAYLDAAECGDDARRRERLGDHARQIRTHVESLGGKRYWEQFDGASPEFVVLFLPGEVFYSAALEHDPSLIEWSVNERVILATPTTLIALLKAVAYGWRQETITQHALEVARLGKELYERLATLGEHFDEAGKGLTRAVSSYNKAIGSLESRVLVTARRFGELGVQTTRDLAALEPIEGTAREIQAAELRALPAPARGDVPVA